jgi:hypothetical protein
MKNILWDAGFRFDDPNNRWGEPSYQLEPGDPGYVPPTINPPQPKRRRMKRNSYYPSKNTDQAAWLGNFRNKLPDHATALSLAAGTVTAAQADCAWLFYVLATWLPAVRTFGESCTNAVREAESGTGGAPQTLPTFTAPAGGTPVNPGALERVFKLVQDIRNNPACTDTIASDLGLYGAEQSEPDWNTFGPVLKITRAPAGVTVGWGWQGKSAFLDQIEIEVDRGSGWHVLAIDATPGYVDTEPIPAAPTKWQYRAIYRVGDQRVGQWSAAASVIVGG